MGRLIDADALKELFSEVIGSIAKKPEMNGNLEHMIRASAMVIQMIDDAPTVQPDTTTHDSIPAETGKNDGDGTSGDCISRQQAIDAVEKSMYENPHENAIIRGMHDHEHRHFLTILMGLPSIQSERKRGKWIERESDTEDKENGFKTVIVCSCCDFPATTFYSEDCENRTQIRTDFCPNCGAKMEKR